MIKRLQQVFSKFFFCLAHAGGLRSFILLVINSKRFNHFQKQHAPTRNEKQVLPVKYHMRLQRNMQPVFLRTYAGDIRMFYEIFWEKVYRLPEVFKIDNGIVIDAGANIGMTALYFSNCFPLATVYCIEPDKENYRLLTMNLREQIKNKRIHAIEAALHAQDGEMGINDSGWAYNSFVDKTGSYPVKSCTMNQFLINNGLRKIDLLKMDIEGAEDVVFLSAAAWLPKINAILIEIHAQQSVISIRTILEEAGFYWYDRNFATSSTNVFLASRNPIML